MIKVMIVEDEPRILRDIKNLIEQINADFHIAHALSNGEQAIEALQDDIPDVLITDIQMPVVNGLELITYIHENKMPIICVILSGYKEFEYAHKALLLGVNDYLLKPINVDELQKLLNKISKLAVDVSFKNKRNEYMTIHNNNQNNINQVLIARIEKYIIENLSKNLSQKILSEKFSLVAPYLSKLFKKYNGLSPTDYITKLRIEKAKEIMDSNPQTYSKDVASLVGVTDPLYFSKMFKKEVGISITEYKESKISNP